MIQYISPDGINQPWIATEFLDIQSRGIPCRQAALRPPQQTVFESETAQRLLAETEKLYPMSVPAFLASVLLAPFLFGRRGPAALLNALFGRRESLMCRIKAIWHLLVASHWARQLRHQDVDLIHAHWIHSAGTVGMYTAWLLDIPFSFTGHAADLFRDRVALDDKIRRADFIVCISEFHRRFYLERGADPEKLFVVYCGLDTDQIQALPRSDRAAGPIRLLSFGRLCEKKGFDKLIDACRLLVDRGHDVECRIAGSGELHGQLLAQVERLGLEDRVAIPGDILKQKDIAGWMAEGDIFVQPCVQARDGDMDGTPRTLMEAMLCRLPAVSTRVAGIPEICVDGETGLLVEPQAVEALADAIERLIDDPQLARRIGEAGREHIIRTFKLPQCLDPLADMFRSRLRAGQAGERAKPSSMVVATATADE
jgi:glycosyltransferase involved in cell wall biosynthesis